MSINITQYIRVRKKATTDSVEKDFIDFSHSDQLSTFRLLQFSFYFSLNAVNKEIAEPIHNV